MEDFNVEEETQKMINMFIEIEKSDDFQKRVDIISSMSSIQVNASILKKTQGGKKMSKYSMSKIPEIKSAAEKVVKEWKRQVKGRSGKKTTEAGKETAQERAAKSATEQHPGVEVKVEEPKPDSSKPADPPARVRQADVEYEEEKKDEASNQDIEQFIKENQTEDKVRTSIRNGIAKVLMKKFPHDGLKCKYMGIQIDNQLIKNFGVDRSKYANRSRTILANLSRSNDFKSRIMDGTIHPDEVAVMDVKDMQDEALKEKRRKQEKQIVDSKRSDFMIANAKLKDGMYTCSKCKSKKTTFYEQQTRSADEPMTTFVQCLVCGHNMKF